jgi:steroid delta-isomerase-like uncharacterized protein
MSVEGQSLRERREALVQRHIDAENDGDVDAMIATFHRPRCQMVAMDLMSDGETAVRALMGPLVRAFPDLRCEPITVHHADEAVIVEARLSGTHRAEWAGIAPRGGRMDLPIVCIFDFDEDRLVNETVYFDFATLQRQLG